MEELKSAATVLQPDPRTENWRVVDPAAPDGHRMVAVEDLVREMATLELGEHVPGTLRSSFAVARNLWIYGWFHYPFYTLASFHAYVSLEAALLERWTREEGAAPRRPPGLRTLLTRAVEAGWVRDEGLQSPHAARARREALQAMLPPDLAHLFAGEPEGEDAPAYVEIVADTLPSLRNSLAHGFHFGFPGNARRDLVLVWELIGQLFPPGTEDPA